MAPVCVTAAGRSVESSRLATKCELLICLPSGLKGEMIT